MSENLIRCFIAIELPDAIIKNIADYISALKQVSNKVRWVRAESIHLTLKFLGEIDKTRLEAVQAVLPGISNLTGSFDLSLAGSGAFPGKKNPRVFWLGISAEENSPLLLIQRWLEEELKSAGFKKEDRRFSPHLTLGRVKFSSNFSAVFEFMEKNPFPPTAFTVNHVSLIQSRLKPQGAEYTRLSMYPLPAVADR